MIGIVAFKGDQDACLNNVNDLNLYSDSIVVSFHAYGRILRFFDVHSFMSVLSIAITGGRSVF